MKINKMASKKKQSKKKSTLSKSIFAGFDSKFIDKVKEDYANSILSATPEKNNKVYNITIPDTYSWWYSPRNSKYKFLCTSIIIDYNLANYISIGGLQYFTIFNCSAQGAVHGYNKETKQLFNFNTATQTECRQFIFDPPIEFFDNSPTNKTPEILIDLGDTTRNITAASNDYMNLTLIGYEVKT